MLTYVVYAERWGWTPDQVDKLTLEQEDWLLAIADVFDKERDYREEKARVAAGKKKPKGSS